MRAGPGRRRVGGRRGTPLLMICDLYENYISAIRKIHVALSAFRMRPLEIGAFSWEIG